MFGKPNAKRVSWSNASANLSYHPTEFIENNQCKMVRKLVAQVKFSYMKHLTTEKCHQPYIAMEMFKPNPASKLDKKICHWFQTQHLFPLQFKTSLVTKKAKIRHHFSKSQSNGLSMPDRTALYLHACKPATLNKIHFVVISCPDKQRLLDAILTLLLKEVLRGTWSANHNPDQPISVWKIIPFFSFSCCRSSSSKESLSKQW